MQAVIWFLARWSSTYLMSPEENADLNSSKVLVEFFGQHNQGKPVLDIIIHISLTALVSYPGEKDLQVCVKRFLLLQSWRVLTLRNTFPILLFALCL